MVPIKVPIAPADPLVAPAVGAVSVISPTGVLDLVDYPSYSDSDPLEDSLTVASELPLVSPFLCSDESEADSESEPAEQRPERHESLTPSYEFPLAPVVAPPEIRRRSAILVRPDEAIPFGRPYRTHPNGLRKLLTVRKRVEPFPAHRLAWRRVSHLSSDCHSSPDFTSDSSSSSSSLDSSSDISSGLSSDSYSDSSSVYSSGCDASGQSYSGPLTRVASPRLVYPLVRTPRCNEDFMRWRSAPLSTLYLPTTSKSSLGSSSERSMDSSLAYAGPSRKRCKSPTTFVPSSTPVSRSIAPALVDLPSRKRFKDSYSSEVSGEEHIEMGTADAETVVDLGISDGVGAPTEDGIDMGVEVATSGIKEDEEEFEAEASTGGTMKIAVDPLVTGVLQSLRLLRDNWRLEEFRQVRRDRDDTRRRLKRTMTNTRFGMTPAAIEEMINRRVTKALETREANRNIKLGNGNDEGDNRNNNGNGNRGGNGNRNHNENDRDARPVV
ncbi:hypothetical protein Tco_0448222 [Tanacetum coccineum]